MCGPYDVLACDLILVQARDMVRRSSGVQRTRDLAQAHADQAREVLRALPDSDAKFALDSLAEKVMKRSH
jgi:hexaprenyl-diphosphate synthase